MTGHCRDGRQCLHYSPFLECSCACERCNPGVLRTLLRRVRAAGMVS